MPGVSTFDIKQGFKIHSKIEVGHCSTAAQPFSSVADMSWESEPALWCTWFYYNRGSGIFLDLGNTLVAINKIDAYRQIEGQPNTIEVFLATVEKYPPIPGTGNNNCNRNNPFTNKPDTNCCVQTHKPTGEYYCSNDVYLQHNQCCKSCPSLCTSKGDPTKDGSGCDGCQFDASGWQNKWHWSVFKPIIPQDIVDKGDNNMIAWIMYGSVNGYTKKDFNQTIDLSDDKITLYNRQLSHFANLGGKGDNPLQNALKASKYDTIQFTVQPEVTGGWSFEILSANIDFKSGADRSATSSNPPPPGLEYQPQVLSTQDPTDIGLGTPCKLVPNPKDSSKQVLQCGPLTWAEPVNLPQWAKNNPFDLMKCTDVKPASGPSPPSPSGLLDCNKGECDNIGFSLSNISNTKTGSCGGSFCTGTNSGDIMYSKSTDTLSGYCQTKPDPTSCIQTTYKGASTCNGILNNCGGKITCVPNNADGSPGKCP